MNFQYIAPIERSKDYLDLAFSRARSKSKKKLVGEWLDKIKKKEMIKLDVVKDQLTHSLSKIIEDFPSLEGIPSFYQGLLRLTLDYAALKKSLGAVDWAIKKIRFFQKEYVRKISKSHDASRIKRSSKEFYGRISSILKQIDKELFFLENCRKIMKKYPDVKEMPTVVIFGFPNVGKTTLLNKLTGSEAKVAGYSFTTKGINSGFLKVKDEMVQVLDVPGTLARVDKMNDIEKIAYLAVKELADTIIYVFDLSEISYGIKKQERLFQNLKESISGDKKILIYLSKTDLISEDEAKKFYKKYKFLSFEELKKDIKKLI